MQFWLSGSFYFLHAVDLGSIPQAVIIFFFGFDHWGLYFIVVSEIQQI